MMALPSTLLTMLYFEYKNISYGNLLRFCIAEQKLRKRAHPRGKLGVSLVEQTEKGSTLFFKLPFTSPFPTQPNAELTVKSCNLWNTLPLSLRKAESFTFFEIELFKYFLLNNNANIIYP